MADALPCKTADVLRRGKPGWQISAGVRRTRVVNQRRGAKDDRSIVNFATGYGKTSVESHLVGIFDGGIVAGFQSNVGFEYRHWL